MIYLSWQGDKPETFSTQPKKNYATDNKLDEMEKKKYQSFAKLK